MTNPKNVRVLDARRVISETLIIGFDPSTSNDQTALSVAKYNGTKLTGVNAFTGEEAEWMYRRLTNKENCNELGIPEKL